jgi:hypothetical protein
LTEGIVSGFCDPQDEYPKTMGDEYRVMMLPALSRFRMVPKTLNMFQSFLREGI